MPTERTSLLFFCTLYSPVYSSTNSCISAIKLPPTLSPIKNRKGSLTARKVVKRFTISCGYPGTFRNGNGYAVWGIACAVNSKRKTIGGTASLLRD